MIKETNNRLYSLFALGIFVLNLAVLGLSYWTIHHAILEGLKSDLIKDEKSEFLEYYQEKSLEEFASQQEDEVLQIFDHQGNMVAQSVNSHGFTLPLDKAIFADAVAGEEGFEFPNINEIKHIVFYFFIASRVRVHLMWGCFYCPCPQ